MGVVWMPYELPARQLPAGLRVDLWDGTGTWPETAAEVELYVLPYMIGARAVEPLPEMGSLRVMQTLTAGYDDVIGARPRGVLLCNATGVHDTSTAELAVTLILASLRGIPQFVRAAGQHRWADETRPALADKQVLVVGYGGVGRAVARRLAPFEVEIVLVASVPREGLDGPVHGVAELPDLLPAADVVVLCVPLTVATRGLVDAGFLERMKDGGLLVNVSRGPVVATDALVAELVSGRLTAALDVTDPEPLPPDHALWSAPGLLLSPHVGGNSSAFRPRADRLVLEQLRRFTAGEPLLGVVAGP